MPFALITLITATRDRQLMGELVNQRRTTVVAIACASAIIAIDADSIVSLLR